MNSGRNNKGFTLIELLVVIAIISLLSAIVMAGLQDARSKARNSYITQTIGQYIRAIELYALDNNGTYPTPNVANPLSEAYCLGDYSENNCGGDWEDVSENAGLNLNSYMSGNPPVTRSNIILSDGSDSWVWRGATYQCEETNNNVCTKVKITWWLEDKLASCGFGALVDSQIGFVITNATECILTRGD